jgi:hypothetical protein
LPPRTHQQTSPCTSTQRRRASQNRARTSTSVERHITRHKCAARTAACQQAVATLSHPARRPAFPPL